MAIQGTEYAVDLLIALINARFNTYLANIDPNLPTVASANVLFGLRQKVDAYPTITIAGVDPSVIKRHHGAYGIHGESLQIELMTYSEEADEALLERESYRYELAFRRMILEHNHLDDITGQTVDAVWIGAQYQTTAERKRAFTSSTAVFVVVSLDQNL